MKKQLSRQDKLIKLNIDKDKWQLLSDFAVNIMYDKFVEMNLHDEKYSQLLYFLNMILITLGLDKVSSVEEFGIYRKDILRLDGEKFLNDNKGKFIRYIENYKHVIYFAKRKTFKNYGLIILKNMCKYYGYDLKTKSKSRLVNNKEIRSRYYCLYK